MKHLAEKIDFGAMFWILFVDKNVISRPERDKFIEEALHFFKDLYDLKAFIVYMKVIVKDVSAVLVLSRLPFFDCEM